MEFNQQQTNTILSALTAYEQDLNNQRKQIVNYLNGNNKHETLTEMMEFLDNTQRTINQVRNTIYSENK